MEKSEDASEQAARGEKVKYLFYISCQGRIIYVPDHVYMMTNLKSPIIGMQYNFLYDLI